IQLAQNPAIKLAALRDWPIRFRPSEIFRVKSLALRSSLHAPRFHRWIESIDIRVDHKEAVDVPQPQKELWDTVFDRLLVVADRRPRRLIGEEVPAQGIGAIAVEDLVRLAIVPLALGHLLPVFAQHEAE